ncbi:MAG: N-methylhydantoinase [Thermomicrobiales bacterium]|nr:N-methylhydantoinase [Thermomicrobiales bacterium]
MRDGSAMTNGRLRLGIDIGGTFTDFVLMEEQSGGLHTLKVPSRPADPAGAVEEGIRRLAGDHGMDPAKIGYFVHGTTIALNALIQRAGVPTGLIITRGFADVLEIGRLRLPNPNDFMCDRPESLVPRNLVREVDERLLATGEILRPLDLDQLGEAVDQLVDSGVEAIAVSFLHSYRNDAHERAAVEFVRARCPDLYVTSSADTWPEQREYERTLVTVMNAYLGAQMKAYFDKLQGVAATLEIDASLFTTKSNGGLMTAASAAEAPVQTLLSGPASGVVGALHVARIAGKPRVISLDIGGTSADVAIIDDGVPYSTEGRVGDFPVIMPTVEISSIGAGGGSIAWVDPAGVLKVGPKSAGSDPGPACYGRGGTQATVTDAYVTLGIIDPARFLGGRMPLDAVAARAALEELGKQIGQSATAAAASVLEVVTSNMYAQLLPIMARTGVDPRDYALLAYGGAGPTHACLLARELGITQVIVPRFPGLLCAYGSLVADLKSDFVATVLLRSDQTTFEELNARFAALEEQARAWLRQQTGELGRHKIVRAADMRYRGQSFELTVTLSDEHRTVHSLDEAAAAFHADYEDVYSQSDRTAVVEFVNVRVTISGEKPHPALTELPTMNDHPPTPGERQIYLDGAWRGGGVYERASLQSGQRLTGPAVIEQDDTTSLLPLGATATVDRWANVLIEVNG